MHKSIIWAPDPLPVTAMIVETPDSPSKKAYSDLRNGTLQAICRPPMAPREAP